MKLLDHKQCVNCGEVKPINAFLADRRKTSNTTHRGSCKDCTYKASSELNRTRYFKARMLYSAYKRALRKNLEFDLGKEDIVIPKTCPLLGIPIEGGQGKIHDGSPSLDRIDNTKGYISGNVWVISNKANSMKYSATIKEWETFSKNSLKFLKTFNS